jgi:pimeloyl-ACP methyl ester carboxylesterase
MLAAAALVLACSAGTPPSGTRAPESAGSSGAATSDTSPTPTASAPRPTAPLMNGTALKACFIEQLLAWCGTLPVAENPATANGRTINLRVVVVPAYQAPALPDPLFVLAGGPGGAASASMGWTATTFKGIHATRDIVLVDQRGTGLSNRLWLPYPPSLDGLADDELQDTVRDWVTGSFAALDADASAYTTAVAMDDLDAVRAALGYGRINLYGASYGATAAQYYIRQHPDRVRSVVLDGATLIDVPVMERIAPNSQRAVDMLFDRCAADPACSGAYPDLRAEWRRVLGQLGEAPVETGVLAPYGGGTIVVTRNLFAGVTHGALVTSDQAARLPWLIHAAASGQWETVGRAIAATMPAPDPGILVMSGIIRCSEAWARFDPDETRRLGAAISSSASR